jgi:hypothetical protein
MVVIIALSDCHNLVQTEMGLPIIVWDDNRVTSTETCTWVHRTWQ